MEKPGERKSPSDILALAISTAGVGFLPLAPGTWGSLVGVGIYIAAANLAFQYKEFPKLACFAITAVVLVIFSLISFWASDRTAKLKNGEDPQIVVVDEILGQLVTFVFISFTLSAGLIVAGFVLFRVFDIWKPYPIRHFEKIHGGIGICADDIVAGVYAGVCLSILNVLF